MVVLLTSEGKRLLVDEDQNDDKEGAELRVIEHSSADLAAFSDDIQLVPRSRFFAKHYLFFLIPLVFFFLFLIGFFVCFFSVSNPRTYQEFGEKLWWAQIHPTISPAVCASLDHPARVDCLPDDENPLDARSTCIARGCCWSPTPEPPEPHRLIPYCYFPPNKTFYNVAESKSTPTGFSLTLVLANASESYLPNIVKRVKVDLIRWTKNVARVRIEDAEKARFKVPDFKVAGSGPKLSSPNVLAKADADFQFEVKNSNFVVRRRSDGVAIFDTSLAPLLFADQFLQLTTVLPGNKIFGLGEHRTGGSILWDMNWTRIGFWALDQPPVEDKNLYGVHPVAMTLEEPRSGSKKSSRASGLFFRNSNAMEAILQPYPAVTFRTIGGILDFFIYSGPTPADVAAAHWGIVGRPATPPLWAMGFHLCRWGYETENDLVRQINRMKDGNFPYTTQWNDIDYMRARLDFTIDESRYSNLSKLIDSLHKTKQRYVMMIDPAISNVQPSGEYPPYEDGLKKGVFVLDNSGQPIVGKVWPGTTVFPDFTSIDTALWWTNNLKDLHDRIGFDGVWIDMNEPSNFVHGSMTGCDKLSLYDYPYYVPTALAGGGPTIRVYQDSRLFYKTLCPSARHKIGRHYDVHSMFGLYEMIDTHYAMRSIQPSKRPLIISRSTFSYSGQFGGHWLGDNSATWSHLRASILGVLTFNYFGVPVVGADICGFNGDTEDELCVRWTQLGAFYPFMRNHNDKGAKAQDPASFTSPPIRKALRKALQLRYQNIPFLYSRLLQASLFGSLPVRAMFVDFLNDSNTWNLSRQFMWGDEMMITPILDPGKTEVEAYFPAGIWYDWVSNVTIRSNGQWVPHIRAPLDHIPVWMRGGETIVQRIPRFQDGAPLEGYFKLIVALDERQESNGDFLWDDEGDSEVSFIPAPPSSPRSIAAAAAAAAVSSVQAWHFHARFALRSGELRGVVGLELGPGIEDREKERIENFLRKKLKCAEILFLGLERKIGSIVLESGDETRPVRWENRGEAGVSVLLDGLNLSENFVISLASS